jgi:pyruvate dehydrogenase E1 component alpha subunit
VFVCENNHYGMSMSVEEVSRLERVADRAAGYAIPGGTVDGNDVQAVYEATAQAVAHARAGNGPTLIEAVTYRWKGHSKSDQNLYRTREEIESWRERDPIDRFEQVVLEAGTLDQAEVQQVRDQARDAVAEAAPGPVAAAVGAGLRPALRPRPEGPASGGRSGRRRPDGRQPRTWWPGRGSAGMEPSRPAW